MSILRALFIFDSIIADRDTADRTDARAHGHRKVGSGDFGRGGEGSTAETPQGFPRKIGVMAPRIPNADPCETNWARKKASRSMSFSRPGVTWARRPRDSAPRPRTCPVPYPSRSGKGGGLSPSVQILERRPRIEPRRTASPACHSDGVCDRTDLFGPSPDDAA